MCFFLPDVSWAQCPVLTQIPKKTHCGRILDEIHTYIHTYIQWMMVLFWKYVLPTSRKTTSDSGLNCYLGYGTGRHVGVLPHDISIRCHHIATDIRNLSLRCVIRCILFHHLWQFHLQQLGSFSLTILSHRSSGGTYSWKTTRSCQQLHHLPRWGIYSVCVIMMYLMTSNWAIMRIEQSFAQSSAS